MPMSSSRNQIQSNTILVILFIHVDENVLERKMRLAAHVLKRQYVYGLAGFPCLLSLTWSIHILSFFV